MFTPSDHTHVPCHPCALVKPSDTAPCKHHFCDTDICWHSNHTACVHQKICKILENSKSCVFPNAVRLVLHRLAGDAKQIIQDPCCNLDWCKLRCVLKKLLIVSMFAGSKDLGCICDDNSKNGGKKIW